MEISSVRPRACWDTRQHRDNLLTELEPSEIHHEATEVLMWFLTGLQEFFRLPKVGSFVLEGLL